MKKLYFIFFTICLFFLTDHVFANTIYSIDMDINIDKNGNANITELWDVQGTDGTEWYKVMNNLGNSEVSDFKVSMDGTLLKSKTWNVNESLSEKKGYYGISETSSGVELCFGKYDYKRHKFTLNYNLSNYVFNTEDSQVLYWKLIDKLSNVKFNHFSVVISSYYEFSDTLDVWGYGYKGYAYVKDGKIYMSNEEDTNMNSNYAVILVKFPLETFITSNSVDKFKKFDDVYKMAEEGTFEYDYNESTFLDKLLTIGTILISIGLPIIIVILVIFINYKNGYGYKNNKKIDKKNTPMFRDIPCNKDIYYSNALIKLNNFNYKDTNIFGAIILKWIKNGKIAFKNETKGMFNKETSIIDLTLNPTFDNSLEDRLFGIMYEASGDGLLEAKELEKWARKHYERFLNLFKNITEDEISRLKREKHIYVRTNKEECRKANVMDDVIYEDSSRLYGLKKYLEEFSLMKEKTAIEVKLWDEYLMFAYLFGMADKVAKQFKNLYPEIVKEMENNNFDYGTIMFVNHMATSSISAASAARMAAESYSSGGGGFSSGGGGGGSFGGGGGGSR